LRAVHQRGGVILGSKNEIERARHVARIDRAHGRGENIAPCPLAPGVRVFPVERVAQGHLAAPVPKISLVERTDAHEMLAERQDKGAGKNRHAIAEAVALADHDLAPREINILHS